MIRNMFFLLYTMILTLHRVASGNWITGVTGFAITVGNMISYVTNGREAARARTRVFTLLVDASQVTGAFRITDTLGPAERRLAAELGLARTRCLLVQYLTDGVRSARRRNARIGWRLFGSSCSRNKRYVIRAIVRFNSAQVRSVERNTNEEDDKDSI